MKIDPSSTSWFAIPSALKIAGGVAAACTTLLATAPVMAETVVSGQSDTIIRMGQTIEKKDVYPVYEYLRLNMADNQSDGSGVTFNFGAWGRADLADKSGADNRAGDLQYAYLTYHSSINNAKVTFGRQFISEGVATERVDGVYTRSDFDYGIGAAAFMGKSVGTEPNYLGGDLVYGTRITHTNKKYYTIGLSSLKMSQEGGSAYREEEGLDVWLRPLQQVDVTGRSSYNSITDGWMEHAYALTYTPIKSLNIGADISNINYKDYFYKVTTAAFVFDPLTNGIDPNEKVLAIGGNASYAIDKNFTISGDYKHYDYDIAQAADYFGAKLTYSLPESFVAGISIHRMDGSQDKLKYNEFRVYASKKLGKADLTLDLFEIKYEKRINDLKNAITAVAATSYEISHSLKIAGDIECSKNPDFDTEFRGLVKLTYLFDTKHAAERGTKSEK